MALRDFPAVMDSFSKAFGERLLARTDLEVPDRALAERWLSLWPGDALPPRALFSPAVFKSFLPRLMLLDTVPDRSITVRLAGTTFGRALGMELTGRDWVAAAPPAYRGERLRIISQIARGAIGVGHRRVPMRGGGEYVCEEILLPFAAEPNGVHPVLVHVDWRPEHLCVVDSPEQAMGDPVDFTVLALR